MRAVPLSCVAALTLIACGEPSPSDPISTGGSAGSSTTGSGGAAPSSGGSPTTSGGASTSGGAVAANGGSAGMATFGGASSGGASLGGASFGGASFGGASFGGAATGGSSFGGFGTSGTSFGGFGTSGSSFGGRNGGGTSSGGASTGGGGATGTVSFATVCATCHGAKGEGIAGKAPEIQHPVRDFSTWVVRNGRQGHPSYPNQVMAAYTAAALPDATLTTFFDALSTPALPKPTTGAALFADYCATCHGASGAGGPAGHNAKGQPVSKALSMVRSGHSLTQFSARNGYMPKWTTTELTDAEVGLIVTHLDSL